MALLRPLALFVVVLLPALTLAPATADDDVRDTLVMRLFDVSSLTAGRTDHIRNMPPIVSPDMVSDEESPLFGAEAEEPLLPLGTVDELIELLRNGVRPWFWEETEGADVRSSGERYLVAKATPAVHAEIGKFLTGLDRANGTMVTVDVQAVHLTVEEAEAVRRGGEVDTLRYGPGAGPSVSVTTLHNSRAAIVSGLVRTWIGEADVEVAQSAKSPEPIVMAGTVGLTADVRPTVSTDGRRVILDVHASLTRLLEDRSSPTGATGTIELPSHEFLDWHGMVRLSTGGWHLVDGGTAESGPGGWSFLVRATTHEMPKGRTPVTGLELPGLPKAIVAPMSVRYFPVPELTVAPEHMIGPTGLPVPTNYTPPEPPEIPEPSPIFPEEGLVDLVRELGPESAWEDPATIEIRNRTLIARNTGPALDGISRVLAALRRGLLREIETRAEVVEVPASVARHLTTGGTLDGKATTLLAEALASGQAVRLAGGRINSMAGARNYAALGRLVPYIAGYNVEIAESATILNPWVNQFFDGVTIDVHPVLSTDGACVQLALRYLRSRSTGELRSAIAGGGARIELPEVEVHRVGSELMLPVGRTAVASSYGQGGRRVLLLLTPRYR